MKHLPGFVPVNFKTVGFILLTLGLIFIFLKGLNYAGLINIPSCILYYGLGLIIISFYLIFIASKK